MTFARKLAERISKAVIAKVPAERKDFAAGLARELDAIPSDFAALAWSLGGLRVLFIAPRRRLQSLDEVPALLKELRFSHFGVVFVCLIFALTQGAAVRYTALLQLASQRAAFLAASAILLYLAAVHFARGRPGWGPLRPGCNSARNAAALRDELERQISYRTRAWWLLEYLPLAAYLALLFCVIGARNLMFASTSWFLVTTSLLSASVSSDISEPKPEAVWRRIAHPWTRLGVLDVPSLAWFVLVFWDLFTGMQARSAPYAAVLLAITALWMPLVNRMQVDRYRRRIADLDALLAQQPTSN